MSQKLFHIPELLTTDELSKIDALLHNASFTDGKLTASLAAKEVKNNLQVEAGSEILVQIQTIINGALQQSPLFNIAALPRHIYPFLVSKYTPGKYYGWHVDSPVMGNPVIRTDLAMTIFLSDPATYEGVNLLSSRIWAKFRLNPQRGMPFFTPASTCTV